MSFTSDVRDELAHIQPECSHCDKATLAALVRIEIGRASCRDRVWYLV